MFRALRRWLRRMPPPTPATRLREEDAIALAREAADEADRELLTVVTLVEREGRVVWVVSTATVGSQLQVDVDDASGRVLERKRVGLR